MKKDSTEFAKSREMFVNDKCSRYTTSRDKMINLFNNYPYEVVSNVNEWNIPKEWLEENIKEAYIPHGWDSPYIQTYHFETAEDAMAFKLVWG